MFEERIAAMNQRTEEAMAANAVQFDKETYTVDEIQDIWASVEPAQQPCEKESFSQRPHWWRIRISKKSFDEWLDHQM
jgi:hypothetical protein